MPAQCQTVPGADYIRALTLRNLVYIAYMDDSDTKTKAKKWQVLTAVMLKDQSFNAVEFLSSLTIENLMPDEKRDHFEEFHACELFGGYGVFEGIEQSKRFSAIQSMLGVIQGVPAQIFYGAINLEHLKKQVYASANPLDITFRMCANGIQEWLTKSTLENIGNPDANDLALFIADDCDPKHKADLQRSFRALRERVRPPSHHAGHLCFVHDDMYFGDSKYSIGIQLADLCGYFIARHLNGDTASEWGYKMIKKQIVYSEHEPK